MAFSKMHEGECRTTKKGMKYCMKGGRVHFAGKSGGGGGKKGSRKLKK